MGIEENIAIGKILYLYVLLPQNIDYDNKYFVIVGTGNFPLLLKINTQKEQSQIAKRFKERQFRLKSDTYRFLSYDSFLDCGTVWYNLITTDDIIIQLTQDPSRIKGNITDDHKREIVRLTNQSKSIEPRHKRIITENLG
jgi:hypothetical protein